MTCTKCGGNSFSRKYTQGVPKDVCVSCGADMTPVIQQLEKEYKKQQLERYAEAQR